ncbi:MAG TPA: response regulator [Patescibacteria group bacterium]|nr:response regulator [Patescibacteria group bacterium]
MPEAKDFTVLVCEDEKAMQEALAMKFGLTGFQVETADNGQIALDKMREKKPSILMLDIIMPVKDGLTVLTEMSADDQLKDIPVILLTNLNEPNKIMEALTLGAKDYVVKADWNIDDIVKKVKDKLGIPS